MKVVRLDPPLPQGWPRPAVAVGNFDGVHRGHQALLRAAVTEAKATGGTAVVLTFDPHPARVLSPERAPATLSTLDQRAEALAEGGAEAMAVLPFTAAVAEEEPEDFARQTLAGALEARVVVVGENFRFGRGRAGDVDALRRAGRQLGFAVRIIAPVLHEGRPISSSRIREALSAGDIPGAAAMLGRPYAVDGNVIPGQARGRTLGAPTANVAVVNEVLPAMGVFACRAERRGRSGGRWPAVVNVGTRPTFGGGDRTVEAHLLDFDGDLYGEALRLHFVARLRGEIKFPSAAALAAQIRRDVEGARTALSVDFGV